MAEMRMPKMGDGMEEGTLLRWIKHEGDTVEVGDVFAEIETDKANVEIPAEDPGVITKIVIQEGETVPVGAVIAYVGGDAPAVTKSDTVEKTPVAKVTSEATASTEEEEKPAPLSESARVIASPLAKRMAREMNIEIALVSGSGPGGRIVGRDINAYAKAHEVPPEPLPRKSPAPPVSTDGDDKPISRMRRAIARRTVQSKQTVPHFYITMPVDMDRAMNLLTEMNAQAPEKKVTVNDLIVKACAEALKIHPDVNVSYTLEDKIRRYTEINIGIAVGTDEGLTIPVVRDCGGKSLREISAVAKEMVIKARTGALTPHDMSGGTFSISNLGMFGVEEFAAIINPPEAAILAVGAVAPEVVVDDKGGFVAKRRMRMTLSCDHRVVDGLLGARFLKDIRDLLVNPLNLLS